ncbi:hypothetical protein SRHO_G00098170 [Serrasalmus rhombeus]
MNLTSMDEVQHKGTIRVIPLTDASAPHCGNIPSTSAAALSIDESSSLSSGCVDTDILSSPESESSSSRSFWPSIFCVPKFCYDAELKLDQGNAACREKGTLLTPDPKLKSNILEGLVQEIVQFKVYVTDKEFNAVGEALISKHPCLTEKGSLTGYAGWKASLKNKLVIYRTHLRKLGCPEVTNSLKHKPEGKLSAASNIKKPRWSEVNYCPSYPVGESDKSVRVELLSYIKKKNNREVINAEFKRITTISLQSKFLSQLDVQSKKLMKLFKKRGGRLESIVAPMVEDDDVELGRECVIKVLCVYLNEDPENLLREQQMKPSSKDPLRRPHWEYVFKQRDASQEPDIGIVLEGQVVLQELDNVALATAMLFGLMYALNLNYPPELKYTFEVLQKVVMELEGTTLSKKAQTLKNRLYQ